MALFLLLKHVFPTHVTMRKAPTKALDPVRQNFPWVRNDENHREGYCAIWDSNSTPLDSETSAFATGPFSPPAGHSFGEVTASECYGPLDTGIPRFLLEIVLVKPQPASVMDPPTPPPLSVSLRYLYTRMTLCKHACS